MDIDKLIRLQRRGGVRPGFGSLMDIDKLIRPRMDGQLCPRFGSLMDIDKLIPLAVGPVSGAVLVL